MQRHQSSLCTPLHGTFGSARRHQMRDNLPGGACPGSSLHGVRLLERAARRTARPLVARLAPIVSPAARTLARPVGIALYVALAVVAMALLLRFSGLPVSPSVSIAELTWSTAQPQGSETREAELDRHAQQILASLSGKAQPPATGR